VPGGGGAGRILKGSRPDPKDRRRLRRLPGERAALALARKLAAERGATLSVFEAVRAPAYVRDVWNAEGEIDEAVDKAQQRLAALGDVESHAELADDAVTGLRRYGASVDLLVLGAHKYRPADRLVERSKSQRLADEPPCSLLVLGSAARDGSDA
jgi:nucleotide-binding universal stress UspA family protein